MYEFLSTVVEEEGSVENLRSIDWKCHNRPYFFRLGKSIFLVGEIQKMVMEEIQLERNGSVRAVHNSLKLTEPSPQTWGLNI